MEPRMIGCIDQKGIGPSRGVLHLYLIRHGETEWALTGQHTGRTDIALTKNGEDKARELGKHLRDIRFTKNN